MEVIGRQAHVAKEARDRFRAPARRAVDDGSRPVARMQAVLKQRQDLGVLSRQGRLDHLEGEVVAKRAAVDQLKLDAEAAFEVVEDVAHDARLGRRRQADERGKPAVAGMFADEAGDVAVVGAEILAPFRQAVRLVDHPVADLALLEDRAHRRVPELLRRDQQDGGIAEPHPVERVVALRQRQKTVDRDAGGDALPAQALDLIGHQGDERRDDHGQRADLVEPGERRQLVADRLAGPGRQNAEHVIAAHRRFDDLPLQRHAVLALRLGPEGGKAEPSRQAGRPHRCGSGTRSRRDRRRTCRAACRQARLPRETDAAPRAASRNRRPPPRSRRAHRRAASPAAPANSGQGRPGVCTPRRPAAGRRRFSPGRCRAVPADGRPLKKASNPRPSLPVVVSQWNASVSSGVRRSICASALAWSCRTSRTSRASCSGSFRCPPCSRPSW